MSDEIIEEIPVEPPQEEIEDNSYLDLVKLIVQRFELNDPFKPNHFIIGFKVSCDTNQRETYMETTLDYNECVDKSDNEICVLAYNKLKHKIKSDSTELIKKKFIVGSEFIPPR